MDDVWDDTCSDDLLRHEQTIRDDRNYKQSFLDGLEKGREESVESGFQAGCAQGLPLGEQVGLIEGSLKVAAVFCGRVDGTSVLPKSVCSSCSNKTLKLGVAMPMECTLEGNSSKPVQRLPGS